MSDIETYGAEYGAEEKQTPDGENTVSDDAAGRLAFGDRDKPLTKGDGSEPSDNEDTAPHSEYGEADDSIPSGACNEEPSEPATLTSGSSGTARDRAYYERLAEEDMRELSRLFPALSEKRSVLELDDPLRYAALRDLGLTPKEAYLATSGTAKYDTRQHLTSAVPKGAAVGAAEMSAREFDEARSLFSGLSDTEIRRLYTKVTK